MGQLLSEETSGAVIAAAIAVHEALGPGLLESVYESCLAHELTARGMPFRRQVEIPVLYGDTRIDCGFRADLIVNDQVVVELKAIEKILDIHEAQLLTYLKLTNLRVGLLLNFNVRYLKNGIVRRVL